METKSYAIICETEEQAKECYNKGLKRMCENIQDFTSIGVNLNKSYYKKRGYTIISYQDAKEKGLLEDTILLDSTKGLEQDTYPIWIRDLMVELTMVYDLRCSLNDFNETVNRHISKKEIKPSDKIFGGEAIKGLDAHETPDRDHLKFTEISKKELEELREKAWKYDELSK